jgi:lysophospholipase L1-like esterase
MLLVRSIVISALMFFAFGSLRLAAECATVSHRAAPRSASALKFDFGDGRPRRSDRGVDGYTVYSPSRGYGFEPGPRVDCRGSDRFGHQGSCASSRPFLFSVALPEGNYRVTVTLGDARDASDTTIKAESRRLMVERAQTRPGDFVERKFTVNVRNFGLPNGGAVALKERERGSLTWDDKLTLEFNGPRPSVSLVVIEAAPRAVTVFLAGDSTVTDQADEPWASWGQMLPRFFNAKVAIANYAESGESLHSFRAERRLEKLFTKLHRGDYLFIQFAHNDQKPGPSHLDAFTGYATELKVWIADARQRGAVPVLVTSMHRRTFGEDGKIVNSLGGYPQAMREVAAEEKVALIDLHAMSEKFYEAIGPLNSTHAFVHYPAHNFPGQDLPIADNINFNAYGAYELAKCVVRGIRAARLPLTRNLVDSFTDFAPTRPDSWEAFRLPASPFREISKPAGN